ncbi:MAG: type II toxin-antitoxin system PemK/MazF family toxin [Candidatus Aminicenantes bacterium]|nr:type II toxin-antitoxin system PemK/MazF family toxin [Candidatus Aminicenantes bacterium]
MEADLMRGDVVRVNLNPTIGSETGKVRPCVIIQNDVGNKYSPVTIVAVITSQKRLSKKYPVDVWVRKGEGGLDIPSIILGDQIRTVDKRRIVQKLGRMSDPIMEEVDKAIKISLALD